MGDSHPKTESDTISLGHGPYGSGGSIHNNESIQNTHSSCTHNDRSNHNSV
jgi:hypothetical protein